MPRWRPGRVKSRPFAGNITELSQSELRLLGKDVNHENCKVCGKDIYFTHSMLRADYQYKQKKKGGTRYYCGYNHWRQDGGGK